MKKLIIGFSTKDAFLSGLIRKIENSEFSHVFIKWHSDSYERDIIYQASGFEVNFIGTDLFLKHSKIIKEIQLEISDEEFKSCMQFCIDNSGIPYGIKQLFGMGYVKLMKLFGKNIKNPFRDGKKSYVCSELIGVLLEKELQIKLGLNLEVDGPKELYNKLKQLTTI